MQIGDRTFFSRPATVLLSPAIHKAADHKIAEIKRIKTASLKDIIFKVTGFEPITTSKDCGGYFDEHKKVIAINPNEPDQFKVFCHELGHFIHTDSGIDTYKNNLISYQLILEQEAEAIGMKVYEAVTGLRFDGMAYFSHEDVKFLVDWYSDWGWHENDLQLS